MGSVRYVVDRLVVAAGVDQNGPPSVVAKHMMILVVRSGQ